MLQPLLEALIHEAVEEVQLLGAFLHDFPDDVLDHGLCHVHIALEVAESHLRLDHPEFGSVALGVGVLGPERGTEGIDIAEGHSEVLGIELAGDGEVCGLSEEILGEVHGAVLLAGRVLGIQGGDPEHLSGALTVAGGDDRGVDIDKAPLLEELMDGVGRYAPHPEGGGEEVGAGPQMLDGPQEFHAVALFLQGIVRGGHALHSDGGSFDLQRLLGLRRQHHGAGDDQGGTHVLAGDLLVIFQGTRVHNHLEVAEAGAVVELNEAEGLHVPDGAGPAAHHDRLTGESFAVGVDRRDFRITHENSPVFLFLRGSMQIPGYCTPLFPVLQEKRSHFPGAYASHALYRGHRLSLGRPST